MDSPPDAEPVTAASTLVAAASEINGPPPIPRTQSRTTANVGSDAITAPKPTKLATLKAGKTDAFAPASIVSRNLGRWLQLAPKDFLLLVIGVGNFAEPPEEHCQSIGPF